ncbi:formylglycine-generating enzyme family protein [Streptomyces sp. NRRL B-24572]|uniref:formylglycine-generating enzyme family protein n=1 Tax=Streptomyces sp. NRRL B-24572 TaxID=1962156 RepID=UPI00117CE74C|nr:formylglycine-generating enzyme family protein [Streptomyces sp. NRRL B-24572]
MTRDVPGCCTPGGAPNRRTGRLTGPPAQPQDDGAGSGGRLKTLDGGWFVMGTDDVHAYLADGEGPVRRVRVSPFAIGPHRVTDEAVDQVPAVLDLLEPALHGPCDPAQVSCGKVADVALELRPVALLRVEVGA